MKKSAALFFFYMAFFIPTYVFAAAPLFTLTPLTATTIQIPVNGAATVQYSVQNQSSKMHVIMMKPMRGVTQITSAGNCSNPFTLTAKQSCNLTLQINGSQVAAGIHNGPIVCQRGMDGQPDPLLCYQPSLANSLHITPGIAQYTVTPSTNSNGTISPNTPQIVSQNASLLFTAVPNTNYFIDHWLVDGVIAQMSGSTFLLSSIHANHHVQVIFRPVTFYVGMQNGNVYYSTNNGFSWTTAAIPAGGNAINALFTTKNIIYAGAANGLIYYSSNNGSSWNSTSSPDSSAVNSVFVMANTLYASTANGFVYYSTNGGQTWTSSVSPDGSSVNGVYVTAGVIYAGTANGHVYYSTNNGASWMTINGRPDNSAIKNVFVSNNTLYVNTANEYVYSTTSLTGGGTWAPIAQTVYSLFVNANDGALYAGTQSGHVFTVTGGMELGFVTFSQINSLSVLSN